MVNMDDKSKELLQKLIGYRRELHKYPELSMKEYETTKRIKNWLMENNIDVLDLPLEVGAIAEIKGGHPGKTIALRADIDALPINEKTGFDFASLNAGVMHACGHDFHTAGILGAAILLNSRKNEIYGNVRIIFQPGEENGEGAKFICEKGILNGVEAIFGMHNRPDLPVGTIGIKSGTLMASVDRFEIDVIGVGGHAGMPDRCIDPIVISSQVISAMQTIVSRSVNPTSDIVISVTRIQSGNTWNVIPDKAEMEGTVRTFQNHMRDEIKNSMKNTAEGVAEALGAKIEFKWYSCLSVLNNDARFEKLCIETAEEIGCRAVKAQKNLGGEDFSFYGSIVPSFFVWMGVDGTAEWHRPSFNLKEAALIHAANYFSDLSIKVLKEYSENNI